MSLISHPANMGQMAPIFSNLTQKAPMSRSMIKSYALSAGIKAVMLNTNDLLRNPHILQGHTLDCNNEMLYGRVRFLITMTIATLEFIVETIFTVGLLIATTFTFGQIKSLNFHLIKHGMQSIHAISTIFMSTMGVISPIIGTLGVFLYTWCLGKASLKKEQTQIEQRISENARIVRGWVCDNCERIENLVQNLSQALLDAIDMIERGESGWQARIESVLTPLRSHRTNINFQVTSVLFMVVQDADLLRYFRMTPDLQHELFERARRGSVDENFEDARSHASTNGGKQMNDMIQNRLKAWVGGEAVKNIVTFPEFVYLLTEIFIIDSILNLEKKDLPKCLKIGDSNVEMLYDEIKKDLADEKEKWIAYFQNNIKSMQASKGKITNGEDIKKYGEVVALGNHMCNSGREDYYAILQKALEEIAALPEPSS